MRTNRAVRVVLGVIVLILFGAYSYLRAVNSPSSADIGAVETVPPIVSLETEPPEETPEPSPSPTPEPTLDPNSPAGRAGVLGLPTPPDVDITSWEFILANAEHSIDQYEPPELVDVEGQYYDSRIVDALNAFAVGAREQGLPVYLSSGYRSYSEQQANFNRVVNNGYVDGKTSAGFYVSMPPGTSEHQTGLCCDITDIYRNPKDPAVLAYTDTFLWLEAHCTEYGFILRFPSDKEEITGVMYEPWHFRYVGVEAAAYITENNLCFEEFVALYTGE